jgi:hypothetical protein
MTFVDRWRESNEKAVFLTACRPSATVPDERCTGHLALCFEDASESI